MDDWVCRCDVVSLAQAASNRVGRDAETRHARTTRHKRVPHVGVSGIRVEVWLLAAIA